MGKYILNLFGMQNQKICRAFSPGSGTREASREMGVCQCEALGLGVEAVGERGEEALSPMLWLR